MGMVSSMTIELGEVFKAALLANSSAIICVHNHPSGNPEPSEYDIDFTKKLIKAGDFMGIEVLDHIIIGDKRSISVMGNHFLWLVKGKFVHKKEGKNLYIRELSVVYKKRRIKKSLHSILHKKAAGPVSIYYLFEWLKDEATEKFYTLHLNNKNFIESYQLISIGSLTKTKYTPEKSLKEPF